MPITATLNQFPSGARYVRLECQGFITKEDAEGISKEGRSGGPLFGLPVLALTQGVRSVSSEARHVFGNRGNPSAQEVWTAIVVTSAVIRVTANFLMRVNRVKKQRLFSTEAEAVQWLEDRM